MCSRLLMLDALEKKGYINRDIDKNNHRNIFVTLITEGHRILGRQYNEFSEGFEKIIGGLVIDNIVRMIRIMSHMIEIASELSGGTKEGSIA